MSTDSATRQLQQRSKAFVRAVEFILLEEGGYVNNARDPGGETKWGISKRAYPDLDIKNLKPEQAKEIYYRDYWQKIRGDDLPYSVALPVFNAAVMSGVSRAIGFLQDAVGAPKDGKIGPITLNRIEPDTGLWVTILHGRFLLRIPGETFDQGWIARLMRVLWEASNGERDLGK